MESGLDLSHLVPDCTTKTPFKHYVMVRPWDCIEPAPKKLHHGVKIFLLNNWLTQNVPHHSLSLSSSLTLDKVELNWGSDDVTAAASNDDLRIRKSRFRVWLNSRRS